MLVSPITSVAGWIVALIVYLMTIFLGVIRIWLVTVMVIGFPISLALKQIPFARKLSSMVEDTLYGLMLASLMSSIAIGVAAYVLADAPGGPVWSATIFAGTGINGISNWVAAAALFTAVLIPTVFAPLTGTLFQTASQAAMVGVGVAASMAGAAAAPVAGAARSRVLRRSGWDGALGGLGKGMSGAVGAGAPDDRAGSGEHHAEHGTRGEAPLRGSSLAEEHGRRRDHGSPCGDGGEQRRQVDSDGGSIEQLRHCFSRNRADQCRETRDCAGVRNFHSTSRGKPDHRNPRLQRSHRAHLRRRVPDRSGSCSEPLVRPAEPGRPRPVPLPGEAEPHHQRSAVPGLGQRPKQRRRNSPRRTSCS